MIGMCTNTWIAPTTSMGRMSLLGALYHFKEHYEDSQYGRGEKPEHQHYPYSGVSDSKDLGVSQYRMDLYEFFAPNDFHYSWNPANYSKYLGYRVGLRLYETCQAFIFYYSPYRLESYNFVKSQLCACLELRREDKITNYAARYYDTCGFEHYSFGEQERRPRASLTPMILCELTCNSRHLARRSVDRGSAVEYQESERCVDANEVAKLCKRLDLRFIRVDANDLKSVEELFAQLREVYMHMCKVSNLQDIRLTEKETDLPVNVSWHISLSEKHLSGKTSDWSFY